MVQEKFVADNTYGGIEQSDAEQVSFFDLAEANVVYDEEKTASVEGENKTYSGNAEIFTFVFTFNPAVDGYTYKSYKPVTISDYSIKWIAGGGSTVGLVLAYDAGSKVEQEGNITTVTIKKALSGILGTGIPQLTLTLNVEAEYGWSNLQEILDASNGRLSKKLSTTQSDNKNIKNVIINNIEAIMDYNKQDPIIVDEFVVDYELNKGVYTGLYDVENNKIYEAIESYENKKLSQLYPWSSYSLLSGKSISSENIEADGFYIDIEHPTTHTTYSFVPLIYKQGSKPIFSLREYYYADGGLQGNNSTCIAIIRKNNETKIYMISDENYIYTKKYGSQSYSSYENLRIKNYNKVLVELQAGGSGGMSALWAVSGADGRGGGGGAYGIFLLDLDNRDYIINIGKGGAAGSGNWGPGGAGNPSIIKEYYKNQLVIDSYGRININQTQGQTGYYVLNGGTSPYGQNGNTYGGQGGLPDDSHYTNLCNFKVIFTCKGGNGSAQGTGSRGQDVSIPDIYNTVANTTLTTTSKVGQTKIAATTYRGGNPGDNLSGAGGASGKHNGGNGGTSASTAGQAGMNGSGGGGGRYWAFATPGGGRGGDGLIHIYY